MNRLFILLMALSCLFATLNAQEKVYPGADEKSPSRAQYFSWINNTNEGPTEKQTLINLDFFKYLQDEYGMILDIYAFDAGLIDGKNFYGDINSARFKKQFPNGLDATYRKAKSIGARLGLWGGPDGFGDTPEETERRKEQIIGLCRDYEWALFKFDAVCGPLRLDKEDDFIDMMKRCRSYSPDLILLNHRLGLKKSEPYATTFLWGGSETYIDVHSANTTTAPHNRAGALSRGLVPGLQRLTEDHGVCLSSCLDYWEDDLILQAFNRSLILAPEIYANPWLLADRDFPKLARIYNLHRKYGKILTEGITLPDKYGQYAVSRGDKKTRLITLRNLSWELKEIEVKLDSEIGLTKSSKVQLRSYHPTERIIGTFNYGETVKVKVDPYRAMLIAASTSDQYVEPGVEGIDFEVIQNIPNKPLKIKLLGMPGSTNEIKLAKGTKGSKITIDGVEHADLAKGKTTTISFEGKPLNQPCYRKLVDLHETVITDDARALYEATVFAADNNALEVRSLKRSGETNIPEVKAARDAFFNQSAFITRGLWDKYMFDGDRNTGFWPSKRYGVDQRIKKGCFRLDLGQEMNVDSIVIHVNNEFELEPLLIDEGNYASISSDLATWQSTLFLSGLRMNIPVHKKMRYLKLNPFPSNIRELEVYAGGKKINPEKFRASNLFADSGQMECFGMWTNNFKLDEVADNSYISVAINGEHGVEGAYAALKIDGKLVGSPSRAVSYPSNPWEYINARSGSNYTYYFPLTTDMAGKKIEVYVMGYEKDKLSFQPEVWISTYPSPFKEKVLLIER
ncbi:hypothetical protein [Prevotella sp. 10(H)]|uniref:hypothetical protein n=1 Tax=Prevotella sp. 10(H) TaxID=1158294 RepID=UPI000A8D1B7F|nr:hypothetical protein [Prevotella sp. 10(H)]